MAFREADAQRNRAYTNPKINLIKNQHLAPDSQKSRGFIYMKNRPRERASAFRAKLLARK